MVAITGSKVHRRWQCPASAVLPQDTSEDREAKTEPARGKGHAIHKYLERVRAIGVEAALSEVPSDLLNMCRALDIDQLPTHLSTEVAYAWNWQTQTARELGRGLGHRDYDQLGVDWSCEVPTTLDVVGMAEVAGGRRGYVGDYKTGRTRYPRPSRFGQTLLGAACIRYVMGLDDVIVELLYLGDDGQCYPVRDLVDGWTLDPFERELTVIMEDRPALEAIYRTHGDGGLSKREGPQCDFCGAFKHCGAKLGLVSRMPTELVKLGAKRNERGEISLAQGDSPGEWNIDVAPGAITVRNAAAVYEACERIEAMTKRMRTEICGMAYHEPIELSDGRVIAPRKSKRREVEGRIAAVVLERHYGRDAVMAKLDIKLPLATVREIVVEHIDHKAKPRQVIESKKGDGVLDKIVDEIAKAGGISVNESEECKPYMPRKPRIKSG